MKKHRIISFKFQKFWKQENGIAATEFVLILPLFILIIFGSAGLFDHLVAQRRMVEATDALADVTARAIEIDNSSATTMFDVISLMMGKYASDTDLSMKVTGWQYDQPSGQMEVVWSKARGAGVSANSVGETADRDDFPEVDNGEMLVEAELTFNYQSPIFTFPVAASRFGTTAMRKPRYIASIVDLDAP